MRRLVAVAVLAMAVVCVPVARASTYSQLLQIYQTKGTIPPCRFSSAQLEGVLKSVDTYAAQYFQDFTNAISAALAQRAAGACTPRRSTTSVTQLSAPVGGGRLPGGPVPAASGAGVPAPIVLLAVFAGLFLLAAVIGGAVRLLGLDPAWAAAWRHSWREAEYRVAGGWLAMVDRLRGRTPDRSGSAGGGVGS
jgi:hypothetical protein